MGERESGEAGRGRGGGGASSSTSAAAASTTTSKTTTTTAPSTAAPGRAAAAAPSAAAKAPTPDVVPASGGAEEPSGRGARARRPSWKVADATAASVPTEQEIARRSASGKLELCSINVRGLGVGKTKLYNLCQDLITHDIDIAAVQETFAGEDVPVYDPRAGSEFEAGYVTLLDNHDTTTETNSQPRQGVGFILRRELYGCISETRWYSARIMSIEGKFRGEDLLIFSVYGPCTGDKYTDDDRLAFVEELEAAIEDALFATGKRYVGRIIILGDFNAEVGQIAPHETYEWGDILGPHLRPERSVAGEYLLEFCDEQRAHGGMTIANSFFQREHSGSFAGRCGKSQSTLDHALVSRKMWEDGWVADAGVSTSEFFLKTSPKRETAEADAEAGPRTTGKKSAASARAKLDKGYDHYAIVLTLRILQHTNDLAEEFAASSPAGGPEEVATSGGTSRGGGPRRRRMPGHRIFSGTAARHAFDARIAGPIASLLEDARTKKGEGAYKDVTELYDELIGIVEKAFRGINSGPVETKPCAEDWLEQNSTSIKALADEARVALGVLRGAGRNAVNLDALVQDHAKKRRALQHALRRMRNAFYESLAAKLQATHAQNRSVFYKQANQRLGPRAEQVVEVMEKGILRPPNVEGGKMQATTSTPEGKAVWLEHWIKTLNVAGPPIALESIESFLCLKEKRAAVMDLDRDVTMTELEEALKKCKGDRCCGEDGMNIGIFKGGETSDARKVLLILINRVLRGEDRTPAAWRNVIIQSIHKKGARNLCSNYRPISLISHCGKLVERIVQGRLEELKARDADLSSDTQWAQSGCSTSDAMIISKAIGILAVKRGCTIHKCFADLKGAFDSVPRALLFEMLAHIGVPERLLALIKSMHDESMARVRWNDGDLSEPFELKCGLKQGAIYSPCLFSLFFNFVTAWIKQECGREGVGVSLCCAATTRRTRVAPHLIYATQLRSAEGIITLTTNEFADDLELNALSIADLQKMVGIFGRACKAFGLVVNYKKTVVMAVEPAQKKAKSAAAGETATATAHEAAAPVTPGASVATRLQSLRPRVPVDPASDSEDDDDDDDDNDDASQSRTPQSGPAVPVAVTTYDAITLDSCTLERVTAFCYLGQLLNSRATMVNELAARRSKMRTTFNRLRENVLGNFFIPIRTRLQFFNAAVIEGTMYACETWSLTQDEIDSLESVQFQLLLRTFYSKADIHSGRRSRKSLIDLIEQAAMAGCKVLPIAVQLQVARLRYYGHIARREVQLRKKGRGPCVHTFLLDQTCRLDGETGTGAIQAAKITFASSTQKTLESARTSEMIKTGKTWLAVAQDAKKQAFSKLVKGEATEKLMAHWVESCCTEHDGRRRAREAKMWTVDPELEDIHDKMCHICERIGTAKRYMCGQCLQVEHLACAGWDPKVEGSIEEVVTWACTNCKAVPFRARTDREQSLPGDEQRFRYHTADDIRMQGKNITTQWAKIQGIHTQAKEAAAEHEKEKAAKRARVAPGEARAQEMQATVLAWRGRSKHARLEARRSAAARRRGTSNVAEEVGSPASAATQDARLWDDDDNTDGEDLDEVWDAYDFEGAPGEVIVTDENDDGGDDDYEYGDDEYEYSDDDSEYGDDAGPGEDDAVEAPTAKAAQRQSSLFGRWSADDDEEDFDEELDEFRDAEVPVAKVVQRQGISLLGVMSAADDEEDVDEDLDEPLDADVPSGTADDEGDSQPRKDVYAAGERGSKRQDEDAAEVDDDGGFAIGSDNDIAAGAARDAPGPGVQPAASSKKKRNRKGTSEEGRWKNKKGKGGGS